MYNIFVVYHLVANINWRTKKCQRTFNNLNGTLNTRTKAAWLR